MSKGKTNRKTGIIIAVIVLVIVVLGVGCFCYLNKVVTNSMTRYSSVYDEPDNSLDGIYLGSSAAYDFFMPTLAYDRYGFCIYNLGTTVQPIALEKNIIEDVLDSQPDMDIVIIELRNLVKSENEDPEGYIKRVTDSMKFTGNRMKAIDDAMEYYREEGESMNYNKWGYYFPALRMVHYSALELTRDDWFLKKEKTRYKGYSTNGCKVIGNIPDPVSYDNEEPLSKAKEKALKELLQYCSGIEQEVIFLDAPFNPKEGFEFKLGEMKRACRMCEEAGFRVLNFNEEPLYSELNLDWSKDYRDRAHVNAFGAKKYSEYLAEYLAENYSFEDHRGDQVYSSWDTENKALKNYLKKELNLEY